ncbi:putative fluoride ion transporter CrcB [Methyloligella halotolerans]|uniref:Fluoride-specific ion channel FluC n=1 Tax=Methyloligella halotolerans TaxID=1177755 RepID=A0A1E2RV85_9HYPH|nr:fluoride efflux transporter CrcB [Methyloligella halotolerans]ODA66045.1 putative fluoride ion transporter CrcB [Methyloligella halotolerans]
MYEFLLVFAGAGLGGALRHAANILCLRTFGHNFPYGTLAVNVVGSFIMGLAIAWFALKADPGQAWRLFLTTGILGGFTTFSTFSLDAVSIWDRGEPALAALYMGMSIGGGIAGLFAAMWIGRSL